MVARGGDTALGEAWLMTRLQKLPPARYIPIRVTLQLISRQTLTPPQFLVITQNCLSASKDVLSQASVNTLQHQLIWQQKWGDQQKLTNSKSEARHWSWWWHDWSSGVITLSVKYSIFLAMALRTRVTVTALRCWKYDILSNLLTI